MKQLILTTEEAKLSTLQKQSHDIAEQCMKLTITDDITLSIATQNLSKANNIVKEIDTLRTDLKKPYLDAGRQIDALSKSLSQPIEQAIDAGKKKILSYQNEIKKKQIDEANRILAIKNSIIKYTNDTMAAIDKCKTIDQLVEARNKFIVNAPTDKFEEFLQDFMTARMALNDYAKSKRTMILTPIQADEEELVAISEAVKEMASSVGDEALEHNIIPSAKGIRKTWTFELNDISKCPTEWLVVNESAIKKYISDNKADLQDGQIINGLRFYQVESLTIR
jgi:hypothetical protein